MSQDTDLTDATDPEVVVLKPAAPGAAIYIGDVVTCVDSVTLTAYDRNEHTRSVPGQIWKYCKYRKYLAKQLRYQ